MGCELRCLRLTGMVSGLALPLKMRHSRVAWLGLALSVPGVRVVRRGRLTTLAANFGCCHPHPEGVSVTLTLTPGCAPWRLMSRTVAEGRDAAHK